MYKLVAFTCDPLPPQGIKSCMIVIFSCSSTLCIPFPRTHCETPLTPLHPSHLHTHSSFPLIPSPSYHSPSSPDTLHREFVAYCKIDICLPIDQHYFSALYFSGHALVRGSYACNSWGQPVSSLTSQTQPTPVQIISMGREGSGDVMCFLFAVVIGMSLSKPHTSVTALRTCACMFACLLACLLAWTNHLP